MKRKVTCAKKLTVTFHIFLVFGVLGKRIVDVNIDPVVRYCGVGFGIAHC